MAFDDYVLIETDHGRGDFVAATLERYRIREKVVIENAAADWTIVTVQGGPIDSIPEIAAPRDRLGSGHGVDYLVEPGQASGLVDRLLAGGGRMMDEETYETLRIEAGRPRWGAELDESVIPLEAGLIDALSFTKGCYVGQEIIARIRSRGHTNRALRRLRLGAPGAPGNTIVAVGGERAGAEIGRITSAAISPELGPIAIGYLRNEYAGAGQEVRAGSVAATVLGDWGG